MNKKKIRTSRAARPMKDLPAKELDATAQGVRGGFTASEHGSTATKGSAPKEYMEIDLRDALITS